MSAGAYEPLGIAFPYKLHFLMAYRTAGVGAAGDSFPIAAFPVLAYQQSAVLSVYFQHQLAALGTFVTGQIIMAESAVRVFDLLDQTAGVILDFPHELPV